MRATNVLLIAFCTMAASCAISLHPRLIDSRGVVAERPESTIGPSNSAEVGPLRVVRLEFRKNDLLNLWRNESTFRVNVNYCNDEVFAIDEVYVGAVSLDRLRFMSRKKTETYLASKNNIVVSSVYVDNNLFNRADRICMKFYGGSMTMQIVVANAIRVK